MANYSTDLESLSTGSGVPSGFTSRWDAGTWSIVDDAGDNVLREASSGSNRYFISMNAVDGDANRANVEMLVRCRASSFATPSNTYLGCVLRGSGDGSTETGYGVLIVTGSPSVRIAKYSGGTNTALGTSTLNATINANTWYWLRARANGTAIKGKVWADGSSEPGTWDIEVTDSSISAAGWNGVFAFIGGVNKDFTDIAVATNGDTAVMSSGATIDCALASATASGFTANISAGSTIACGIGEASASGFAASIQTGAVIDCAVATADASGFVATVASDITISCALASATASGFAADIVTIAIKDDYERSSVNLSGSSVTGAGDSAVIVIKPRVQESEVKSSQTAWLEPSAKITGINGVRPTFRFSDYASTWTDGKYHGTPWGTGRRPMYSYDRLTWNYFDTQTVAASYIEFRLSTAFTADTVYISRERQVSVTQTGDWIAALAAAHPTKISAPASATAFTPTLTSWPAQDYIADEFSAQTNELGATIPATPLYAFEINDTSLMPVTGVKRVAMMVSGVHAGEDTGNWAMMRAVEYMLGSGVEAQYVRRHFRVLVYPMLNAPGRYGGGWRGSFTQGTSGADDANRHFPETGSALQIVDKPKAAMHTDRASVVPTWVVDWHGQFEAPWGYFSDSPALVAFANVLSTEFGTTVADMGGLHDSAVTEYWRINQSSPMSMTLEFGNNVTVTDAQYEAFGTAFVASLETYFQYIDCSVGTATASGFAADISSPITIDCSIGEASASGFSATISNSSDIECGVGSATASGFNAEISSAIAIDCTVSEVSASGYQAVVSSPIAINASIGTAVASGFTADVTSPIVISCGIGYAAAAGFAASFGDPTTISAILRYTVAQESRRFSVSAESRNYTIKES